MIRSGPDKEAMDISQDRSAGLTVRGSHFRLKGWSWMDRYKGFLSREFPNDAEVFWLHSKIMDVGGGNLTKEEIDQLADCPDLDTIRISGLRQNTFEYFITTYGRQFKKIHFFKNKLVEDWSLLAGLPELESLYWFHNQRIASLWDLSGNRSLRELHISDFTRLHQLSGIATAPALRLLFIGDSIWPSMNIESLGPLTGMPLECLAWHGKSIADQDLSFIATLKHLKWFDCPIKYFTSEQCAWIAANCPGADGREFHPYEIWRKGDREEAAIVGKRKPVLELPGNEMRIRRYADHFNALKEEYRGVPYKTAFPEFFCDEHHHE